MKIATYNVWYPNIDIRTEQLIQEIGRIDADIIGLQEVPLHFYENLIGNINFPYHAYISYKNEYEDECYGLAFLCKYPLCEHLSLFEISDYDNSIAHNAIFEADGIKFSITNIHLPWDSALAKEKQIVAIDRYIHEQRNKADFFILVGDFNSALTSSVHNYLLGNQTLLGCESKPYWNDLASSHAALNGYEVMPTLDFVNNPRWHGRNTNYIPIACDRIYVMESFNWDNEFHLRNVSIFGKEASPKSGFAPSDHYGLLAEVEFTK